MLLGGHFAKQQRDSREIVFFSGDQERGGSNVLVGDDVAILLHPPLVLADFDHVGDFGNADEPVVDLFGQADAPLFPLLFLGALVDRCEFAVPVESPRLIPLSMVDVALGRIEMDVSFWLVQARFDRRDDGRREFVHVDFVQAFIRRPIAKDVVLAIPSLGHDCRHYL
ncbi:hypothetical protein AC1031_021562 [Aphanomyces cochlioides]|nr:hypothetical protein AC1031_021562 [Aphanomyces cochlioides]